MSVFVDEAQLNVRGGDGGAGCVSFRREGPEAMGGPNGGDGGKGGDVWLLADRNVASLLAFRDHPHRRGSNGVHGKGKDLHGKRGEVMEVRVPEGTLILDMYTDEVLADLTNHGDRWMAAGGGRGVVADGAADVWLLVCHLAVPSARRGLSAGAVRHAGPVPSRPPSALRRLADSILGHSHDDRLSSVVRRRDDGLHPDRDPIRRARFD